MPTDGLAFDVLIAAASVAFAHTLLGPDHYVPFLALARARGWGLGRTLAVAGLCGLAHVLSSIVLGGGGLLAGAAIGHLEFLEEGRGDLAAWVLVAFGTAYAAWGVRHALRRRRGYELHRHGRDDAPSAHDVHVHAGGGHAHVHVPAHADAHAHAHAGTAAHASALTHAGTAAHAGTQTTFWALFVIFVLGPCEPLIPLFVLPASRGRWGLALAAAAVFAAVTIAAMLAVVALGHAGLARLRLGPIERWSHAVAGSVVAASGLAVLFLGL